MNKKLTYGISKNGKPFTRWIQLTDLVPGDFVIYEDECGIVNKDLSIEDMSYNDMWSLIDAKHLEMLRDRKLKELGIR